MRTILNHYEGNLRTKLEHVKSKRLLITDAPTDNKGKGESFSPTDTVAGALNLDSPPIVIPAGVVVPRVAIDQYVATEGGWDGGNLKVSVNGGDWIVVPDIAFDYNGYFDPGVINAPPNDNPLAGEEGWTGGGQGSVATGWGQSQISLEGLATGGDTVVLRFDMGLDGCNGVDGWYADEIEVYSCEGETTNLICGDG